MRSGNPTLNSNTFQDMGAFAGSLSRNDATTMTIQGTALKTLILLAITVTTAGITWVQVMGVGNLNFAAIAPWMFGGMIVSLILSLIICAKPATSPYLAPLYAAAEGFFLGGLSSIFELRYPGIVVMAVGCTFGTLFGLVLAYMSGIIKATENFKLGIMAATIGLGVVYLISFIGGFFGFPIPFIHSSGLFGILFSLFAVAVAALNLVLDFDFIENAAERGAPKHLEWYGAFALMVTLVWLYVEILRLLSKLNDRK